MDKESPKLLVVAGTKLTPGIADYALKVAVRLDLEIILLFIDDAGTWSNTREHRAEVERFEARVEKDAAAFSTLAWKSAVKVTTIVDVGNRKAAIDRIREQDQTVRFILSDINDEQKVEGMDDRHPQLTVIRPV